MTIEEEWRAFLMGTHPDILRGRRMFGWMPSATRCRLCRSPFQGIGSLIVRPMGIRPWEKNPNLCRRCVTTMASRGPSGAEIDLTLLFADVRGSTGLAERIGDQAFSALLNRFYQTGTSVLLEHNALVDKFVGDEVIGLFIPGIVGEAHAASGVQAARDLLAATGHGATGEPWLPLGIGVHSGVARVGLVGAAGVMDFTALGDSVNTAARLASDAAAGEILVSQAAAVSAGLPPNGGEHRQLQLRGRDQSIDVLVLHGEGTPATQPV